MHPTFYRERLPDIPSQIVRRSVLDLRRAGMDREAQELEELQLAIGEMEEEIAGVREETQAAEDSAQRELETVQTALADLFTSIDGNGHADDDAEDMVRELAEKFAKVKPIVAALYKTAADLHDEFEG